MITLQLKLSAMRGLPPWSDSLSEAYFLALVNVPDSYLSWVTEHIAKTFESKDFRPEPGDIRGMIYEWIAPCPSLEDALAEVFDIANRHGRFARRVDGRNIYVEGDPVFSHTIVSKVIDAMGGWRNFVSNDKSDTATIRAQFRDLYNSLRRDRRKEGQAYLERPIADWPLSVRERWVKPKQISAPPPVSCETSDEELVGPPASFQGIMDKILAGAK